MGAIFVVIFGDWYYILPYFPKLCVIKSIQPIRWSFVCYEWFNLQSSVIYFSIVSNDFVKTARFVVHFHFLG